MKRWLSILLLVALAASFLSCLSAVAVQCEGVVQFDPVDEIPFQPFHRLTTLISFLASLLGAFVTLADLFRPLKSSSIRGDHPPLYASFASPSYLLNQVFLL